MGPSWVMRELKGNWHRHCGDLFSSSLWGPSFTKILTGALGWSDLPMAECGRSGHNNLL